MPKKIFLISCFVLLLQIVSIITIVQAQQIDESEYIDIRGSVYQRLKLYLDLGNFNTTLVKNTLERNLLWSGVFELKEEYDAELKLEFIAESNNSISTRLTTDENVLLFERAIELNDNQDVLEKNVIELLQRIIFHLTKKKGILGTAIIYAEQKLAEPKRIVITDTHNRIKSNIIKNYSYNILPKWSPNGSSFIYTENSRKGSRVAHVDLKTKKRTTLIYSRTGISSGGTWNKKTKDIIATISSNGNPDLYLFTKKGFIIEKLTTFSSIETSPSYSPDGKEIVFVSSRSGSVQLYKMNLLKKMSKRISFIGRYNTDPKWSNDGRYIVYAGRVKGVFQIFLMNAITLEIKQLTFGNRTSEEPNWSPDDRLIIFSSKISGESKIYIMTVDGKYIRKLTKSKKGIRETNPDWTYNFNYKYLR